MRGWGSGGVREWESEGVGEWGSGVSEECGREWGGAVGRCGGVREVEG